MPRWTGLSSRLQILIMRRVVWIDEATRESTTERVRWRVAWALAGVHSYD